MPIKYSIYELTNHGRVLRDVKFTAREAEKRALELRKETRNPCSVDPEFTPPAVPETAEIARDLYREVHGPAARLDDQPFSTKVIYRMLAETAASVLRERGIAR
jgi:hypothetical protein